MKNITQIISLDEGMFLFNFVDIKDLINFYDENRFNDFASRQSGKSITCCILIMGILFKSQVCSCKQGAIAREMIARIVTMLESVPFFLVNQDS